MDQKQIIWNDNDEPEDLENLRLALGIECGTIVILAELGLWNRTVKGYKVISGSELADCFYCYDNGVEYKEFYIDGENELRATGIHHDGTNRYLFRCIDKKTGIKAKERILNGTAKTDEVLKHTKPIGKKVLRAFKWT